MKYSKPRVLELRHCNPFSDNTACNIKRNYQKITGEQSIEGKIILGTSTITCQTRVLAKTKIITDTAAMPAASPLPAYRLLKDASEESDIHLYAFTSFAEINEELNSQLNGKIFK